MQALPEELQKLINVVQRDSTSGASSLVDRAAGILSQAITLGRTADVARALCQAQPTMAPVWNLALHAVAADGAADAFDDYLERLRRWTRALVRTAVGTLTIGLDGGSIRLVTISASGSVLQTATALRHTHEVTIACAESRPALEGRRLARHLSELGVRVTFYTDAALAAGLAGADAVLVGADAVGPHALINKVGTGMLAAAASQRGIPVYAAATRDKLAMPALWPHLALREGPASEVWDAPPPHVSVRNPYFETVPLDLVAGVITDLGVLGADMMPDVCAAQETPRMLAALERLLSRTG